MATPAHNELAIAEYLCRSIEKLTHPEPFHLTPEIRAAIEDLARVVWPQTVTLRLRERGR